VIGFISIRIKDAENQKWVRRERGQILGTIKQTLPSLHSARTNQSVLHPRYQIYLRLTKEDQIQ